MPYWVINTFSTLPAFAALYLGLGVPLALVALPRADWRRWPLVVMTGAALAPALLTAYMFALGSFGLPLLTRANVLYGLAVMLGLAWGGAWIKSRRTVGANDETPLRSLPLEGIEVLLLTLLGLALIVRYTGIAYWPFTAYDALWVYGYEGRLYFLTGMIPAQIGYYPQFMPLQYTFGQLIFGAVDDSAARTLLFFTHTASILAAYNLGAVLFNRRTGIMLAALWGLYPAVAEWSRMGDLEIPLTFLLTAAAVFFFRAWRGERPRHYAVIAGLIYGVALWTKPTAGAFALGVMLVNGVSLVVAGGLRWRTRQATPLQEALQRLQVSVITALACIPLGGVWYVRNLLLGHAAVDFPPPFWFTLAERGGGQLLWPLAAIVAGVIFVRVEGAARRTVFMGMLLLALGVMPSVLARFLPIPPDWVLWLYPSLDGLPRLGLFEWWLISTGAGLLVWAYWPRLRNTSSDAALLGWILLAALPYFITFFWNYSYHSRLLFAIVPLLALPTAYLLARGFTTSPLQGMARHAPTVAVIVLAVPGVILPLYDPNLGWGYIWRAGLTDATAKLASGNDALMWMVDGFQIYARENGHPPVVAAPGVKRLPFFFPTADIRIADAPTRLTQLDGVTYFVNSHPDGTEAYMGVPLQQNQVLSALGRADILRKAWWRDDGIFRYEIYELFLENRFVPPTIHAPIEADVTFGGFARLLGHDIGLTTFQIGEQRVLKLFWQAIQPADADYMIYIHLRDAQDNVQMTWDSPVALTEDRQTYYTTLVWEPSEYILDERFLRLTNLDAPPGEGYTLVVGMYNLVTGERLPVTVNGTPAGDGYRLDEAITVIPR